VAGRCRSNPTSKGNSVPEGWEKLIKDVSKDRRTICLIHQLKIKGAYVYIVHSTCVLVIVFLKMQFSGGFFLPFFFVMGMEALTKFINFYCYFCKNIIHQLQTRRLGDGCL
jgi:hypothetical protein